MQSKKSTNTTNPKSSITFDIKNAGIVGNSYTPTTFNNVAASEKKDIENMANEFSYFPVEESNNEY